MSAWQSTGPSQEQSTSALAGRADLRDGPPQQPSRTQEGGSGCAPSRRPPKGWLSRRRPGASSPRHAPEGGQVAPGRRRDRAAPGRRDGASAPTWAEHFRSAPPTGRCPARGGNVATRSGPSSQQRQSLARHHVVVLLPRGLIDFCCISIPGNSVSARARLPGSASMAAT